MPRILEQFLLDPLDPDLVRPRVASKILHDLRWAALVPNQLNRAVYNNQAHVVVGAVLLQTHRRTEECNVLIPGRSFTIPSNVNP